MAGSKTILYIEDDSTISDMYAKVLEKSGYRVTIHMSGKGAVEKAREKSYDLILLDIWLPEKDGMQILKELRGNDGQGLPQTKIVITTNYTQDDESRTAMASQADGYFIKANITPRQLVKNIQDLIGPADA